MSETIEQFAARVSEEMGMDPAPHGGFYNRLVAFLATLPPRVVEVTPDDLRETDSLLPMIKAQQINARLRARAPLPAPRPAVDVEKIADALAEEVFDAEVMRPQFRELCLALLRRHVTDTGPAKSTLGIEAFIELFRRRYIEESADRFEPTEVLRILRDTLRQVIVVTNTGWITVPTTQTAGELQSPVEAGVDPETYVVYVHPQVNGGAPTLCRAKSCMREGFGTREHTARWCVPGRSWVERSTPTTTRAWTPESVKACVGKRVWIEYPGGGCYALRYDLQDRTPDEIAEFFNRGSVNGKSVTAFYILPELPR